MPNQPVDYSAWIPVELDSGQPIKRTKVGKTTVTVFVSPFDVPLALRGTYLKKEKRLIIQFQYLDNYKESLKLKQINNVVQLKLGKNSGRLFELELEIELLKPNSVDFYTPKILSLVNHALHNRVKPEPNLNFLYAEKALKLYQNQLLNEVY